MQKETMYRKNMKMTTCGSMSQPDCEKAGKNMGCNWNTKLKTPKCQQKRVASHSGSKAKGRVSKVTKSGISDRYKNTYLLAHPAKKKKKRRKKSAKKTETFKQDAGETEMLGGGWSYIVNPQTGRKVNINGKLGQKVLMNYVNML